MFFVNLIRASFIKEIKIVQFLSLSRKSTFVNNFMFFYFKAIGKIVFSIALIRYEYGS